MSQTTIPSSVLKKAENWLHGNYDNDSKNEVREMINNDPKELINSFYKDLDFGTGGLRGIMGTGTNKINKYTIGMATQGFANYLIKMFPNQEIKVAVACDSRNNSDKFARITAEVFSANNIHVYLFDELRPTPELSFAIRHLKCQGGIVITASHNPKEYNGYKVYWNDGAQLINPHDRNVIDEVTQIKNINDVKFEGRKEKISIIGEEIDREYLSNIKALSLSPELAETNKNLKIVFTAIHGTGYKIVPQALADFGFSNVYSVKEQDIPDGNFPTVKSPNPEEHEALNKALQKAEEIDADLVMGTDPDADRVGIAVKDNDGKFILLNGNQTATLLVYYLLHKYNENKKILGNEYIVKTIVTSEILRDIADSFSVETMEVLTGFKFIADIIKQNEGNKTYIGGGEESYGYLIGDFVRDKDAVSACCMIAETAAWARKNNKSLYELLIDIYCQFGLYNERLLSITKKGKDGADEIKDMMERYRNKPLLTINNKRVARIKDYLLQSDKDLINNSEKEIKLPKSNVLQFILEDNSIITARPSGTEPKIKFYFSIKQKLSRKDDFDKINSDLNTIIDNIIDDMKLNN